MANSKNLDLFLLVLTSVLDNVLAVPWFTRSCATRDKSVKMKNSAFVFVKPHANTPATQAMVKSKLTEAGITILSEADIAGSVIDEGKLIDQHYYAIASKATLLNAADIPVPEDKFEAAFGESWKKVVEEDRTCNAMEACKRFECTADELDEAWGKAKTTKFGGGFYCGLVTFSADKPSLYVFNAFFMSMRSKFVGEGTSIHCYEVEWDASALNWESFRNELLGPTNPADAPVGSIRRTVLDSYEELGLTSKPNKGDNGVHASASPFEGLAEKNNWLKRSIESDSFGKALIDGGMSMDMILAWSVDPRVTQPDGSKGSIFDALEDMDAEDCLKKMLEIAALNK
eukprot:CAMPEP_0118714468 /NCGR_PEP_ID=MMETSP0800-20121206/26212_1 /TAXON_ID=210618 ORGANISM="Striatella unipunctata, Strain CCMP2910" /NCGR_SAMPLE_ID=MMETSP0800 /ASSEMBLY_ACC=CAM_ASM_000638 /LENGTH=342 /DNA_ID=CAMNT_0006620281 /DNA_START=22 /DNA_END=1050 /DNA_ORIENTATION=+